MGAHLSAPLAGRPVRPAAGCGGSSVLGLWWQCLYRLWLQCLYCGRCLRCQLLRQSFLYANKPILALKVSAAPPLPAMPAPSIQDALAVWARRGAAWRLVVLWRAHPCEMAQKVKCLSKLFKPPDKAPAHVKPVPTPGHGRCSGSRARVWLRRCPFLPVQRTPAISALSGWAPARVAASPIAGCRGPLAFVGESAIAGSGTRGREQLRRGDLFAAATREAVGSG